MNANTTVPMINYINIPDLEIVNINKIKPELGIYIISSNIGTFIKDINKYFLGFIKKNYNTYILLSDKYKIFYEGDTVVINEVFYIFHSNNWMRLGFN